MKLGLLGRKICMRQIFAPDGKVIPVTLIEAGPCQIVQKKEGYGAVQIGFMEKKEKNISKPLLGHFKKAGLKPKRFLKEFRLKEENCQVGQILTLEIFEGIRYVDITGISKGKGFTGVMKRWNFHGGPASRGSMTHRISGSIGDTDPARIYKGKRMAGRMGGKRITLQSLEIVKCDAANNLLVVKGAVPGPAGGLLIIKKAVKKKHRMGLKEEVQKKDIPKEAVKKG